MLDFGFRGFWILEILGRSRGSNTRQFGDGAWRSEAWILPGLPLGATSKPTVSDRVGARKEIELQNEGQDAATICCTVWSWFLGVYVHVLATALRDVYWGSEAWICCDLPWGPLQNQLYLIELVREHKSSYRDYMCPVDGLRQPRPPPRGNCPGWRPQAPACFK